MSTLKIRQTIALMILCIYFILQIFEVFGITYTVQRNQKFFYVIDTGHGRPQTNNCGSKSVLDENNECFYEWIYNWNIGVYLGQMLKDANIDFTFINTDTTSDISLDERIKKINSIHTNKKAILISIHANAASPEANGFEVYSPKGEYSKKFFYPDKKEVSDSLANIMYKFLSEEFPEHNMREKNKSQNFKEAAFKIIAKTKCYAILTENEFFTNPTIRKKMRTRKFKFRVAKAHFNCIEYIEKKF